VQLFNPKKTDIEKELQQRGYQRKLMKYVLCVLPFNNLLEQQEFHYK
jgi:hypothetical protein